MKKIVLGCALGMLAATCVARTPNAQPTQDGGGLIGADCWLGCDTMPRATVVAHGAWNADHSAWLLRWEWSMPIVTPNFFQPMVSDGLLSADWADAEARWARGFNAFSYWWIERHSDQYSVANGGVLVTPPALVSRVDPATGIAYRVFVEENIEALSRGFLSVRRQSHSAAACEEDGEAAPVGSPGWILTGCGPLTVDERDAIVPEPGVPGAPNVVRWNPTDFTIAFAARDNISRGFTVQRLMNQCRLTDPMGGPCSGTPQWVNANSPDDPIKIAHVQKGDWGYFEDRPSNRAVDNLFPAPNGTYRVCVLSNRSDNLTCGDSADARPGHKTPMGVLVAGATGSPPQRVLNVQLLHEMLLTLPGHRITEKRVLNALEAKPLACPKPE